MVVKRGSQLVDILAEKKTVDFAHWAYLFTYVPFTPVNLRYGTHCHKYQVGFHV